MEHSTRVRGFHLRDLDDSGLVERSLAGHTDAFAVLVRRHDIAMRRLVSRLLVGTSSVDDVLQNAYVNAYRSLARFRTDATFGSWLYRITYNACLDEMRKRRDVVSLDDGLERRSTRPEPERTVVGRMTVQEALRRLPFDQRATVVLVDGEGFDMKTAAELLGVAPGTVASRLSRARAALRATLEENT